MGWLRTYERPRTTPFGPPIPTGTTANQCNLNYVLRRKPTQLTPDQESRVSKLSDKQRKKLLDQIDKRPANLSVDETIDLFLSNRLQPLANDVEIRITHEFLKRGARDDRNGALTKEQLKLLGLTFPLKKGWKKLIVGTWIPEAVANKFLSLKNA